MSTDAPLRDDRAASGAAPGVEFVEVPWDDPRAAAMRAEFDAEMTERYGDGEPTSETQALRLEGVFGVDPSQVAACLLVLVDGAPAAHGALFRRPEPATLEIRKVVVARGHRGRRLGMRLMQALEDRAVELGARRAILDTGPKQPDAIGLYERRGFERIPAFPPYTAVPTAICFEKRLSSPGAPA